MGVAEESKTTQEEEAGNANKHKHQKKKKKEGRNVLRAAARGRSTCKIIMVSQHSLTGVNQQQADLFASQDGVKLRRLPFFSCSNIRLEDVVLGGKKK